MKITIHQPEHLPWLGLIDKISQADVFVVLDTVQYEKKYFQNRNKIRADNKDGFLWLTAGIKKFSHNTLIKDILLSYDKDWVSSNLNKIWQYYHKADFFDSYFPALKSIFEKKFTKLADLNYELLVQILEWFDIKTKIIKASSLGLPELKGGTKVNLEISKALKADEYLSGPSGKSYLNLEEFEKESIKVSFHSFVHPAYKQLFEPFMPAMSSIDLLFNYGKKAKDILVFSRKLDSIAGKYRPDDGIDRSIGMKKLCSELIKYGIGLSSRDAIELFAREGDWQTHVYAHMVKSLELWEIDAKCKAKLKKNFPTAAVKITDSIKELKTSFSFNKKYGFIVIDNPQACYGPGNCYCEHFDIITEIHKIAQDDVVVIFNVNKEPFNYDASPEWKKRRDGFYKLKDTSKIPMKFFMKFYKELFKKQGFEAVLCFDVSREELEHNDYLYYLVFHLKKT